MDCNYLLKEGTLRFLVPAQLDHHAAGQVRAELDMFIEAYPIQKVIFDFKDTEFMDSSGIGVMMGRYKKMSFVGGTVEAQHLSHRLKRIFMMSGLYKIIIVDENDELGQSDRVE